MDFGAGAIRDSDGNLYAKNPTDEGYNPYDVTSYAQGQDAL